METSFRDCGRFTDLRATVIHGGVGYGKQRSDLRAGMDVVVATVGRMMDFLNTGELRLDALTVLVLDEVDRMLDMGFLPDVKRIIQRCPKQRQTLFFSATIPPEIQAVASFALRNPAQVEIGAARAVVTTVTHAVYPVSQAKKFDLLLAMLAHIDFDSVLIFSRTKHGADRIARRLKAADHSVAVLHANRSQNQRTEALAGFKSGRYEVMVATDIAARGIDVAGISHVINYDVPKNPEDYVHRIGRTGRALAVGDAFTLATPEEAQDVRDIERFIGQRIPQAKLEGFDYGAAPLYPPRAPQPGHGGGQPAQGGRGYRSGGQRQHGFGGGQHRGQPGGQPQRASQPAAGPARPQAPQPRPQAGGLTRGHWNPNRR